GANRDSCIFIEQQERKPVRYSASYDPSASTRSTQTSPLLALKQLSTYGSTLIVDSSQQSIGTNNRLYEQRLKIHSGSQRLANNLALISETDIPSSSSELVEESRYSYEEYLIHVDDNQEQKKLISSSTPTSASSVTTIIAQQSPQQSTLSPSKLTEKKMLHPEEFDSDRTSRLSGDDINTHSSTSSMSGSFTNHDWPTAGVNNSSNPSNNYPIVNTRQTIANQTTRISSWPPAPNEEPPVDTPFETSFILDESDEQRRPSRVQFAEQLVRVIPPSATNSLSEESTAAVTPPPPTTTARTMTTTSSAPAITPRTSTTRPYSSEIHEQNNDMDIEEDDTTATTTTSSNQEVITGRLQRTSGLTNLNEVMMTRPTVVPPPPPPPSAPPPPPPPATPPATASGVDPRLVRDQLQRLDYKLVVDTRQPKNQSKWVKDHMDAADVQKLPLPQSITTTIPTGSGRVGALRSLFEQQSGRSSDSSTLNSPTGQIRRTDPEERPSRHGDEIRFRIKQPKSATIHHAEPAQIIQRTKQSTNNASSVVPLTWEDLVGVQEEHQKQWRPQYSSYPFELDEIQQIIGKRINSLDDTGYYSQNDHTWRWNDIFWRSLTSLQHDQLNRLLQSRSRQDSGDTQINEHSDRSAYQGDSEDNTPKFNNNSRRIRSQNSSEENLAPTTITRTIVEETKRIQSTINDPGLTVSVTGAGAWQQQKQPTASTGIGKYTETSTIHENHPSISVFGSTPNGNYARVGSQESIASSTIQPQSFTNKKPDNQMTIIESGY
ncbi:unnamed protein product, partial [Rotaria socialis]